MRKKIMVTGASGFVGGHILKRAPEECEITAIYHTQKYPFSANWIQVDLADFKKTATIIQEIKPEVIIHCAATADLEKAEAQPQLAYENNVLITKNLTEISAAHNIRLIFISTDMIYDGKTGMYNEEDLPHPLNFYGRTKVEAEEYIQANSANYVIARSALIYGLTKTARKTFCETMIRNWQNEQPVNLFRDEFRSPILVENLADALLELAQLDYTGKINLGGPTRISRLEFGMVFAKLFAVSSHLIISRSMQNIDFKAKRPADTSYDITLAKSILETKIMDCYEGAHYLKRYLLKQ